MDPLTSRINALIAENKARLNALHVSDEEIDIFRDTKDVPMNPVTLFKLPPKEMDPITVKINALSAENKARLNALHVSDEEIDIFRDTKDVPMNPVTLFKLPPKEMDPITAKINALTAENKARLKALHEKKTS
jgi:hypothetical protein